MEDVYLNYEVALGAARSNAQQVAKQFTWDETARKYLDAIGRDQLELPDVEPIEWVEPTQRRYLVRVNSTRFFEVGGLQYLLEPRKDYWEPADVKRVLFDGGHLDLSCLPNMQVNGDADRPPAWSDLESGLTKEQCERIPEYTGSHAFCPTCTQRLNTNMPTLEELEALPVPRET